ncbi:F0F1 ATP synthase subunit gamma, partial [Oleiphilus sp. HI0079]|uniref:ATP synthase F1 subunit gamma n=1 Tax=Oleiphilus sp. HI0079 TaxID=1822254 RepID=UPI0007C24FAA
MAVGKEIRNQISSVKSTQKITSAMQMVAASKMRKAQERMSQGKPYADKIRSVVSHLANANPEYNHLYLQDRDVKRVGYIVVSTDRGLCGGLNVNLFKRALADMKEWDAKEVSVDVCAIGSKAISFFKNYGGNVVAALSHLGDEPSAHELIGSVKVMLDAFDKGEIDRLYVVYNKFVTTMTQEPGVHQLLSLASSEEHELQHHSDYIYEPDANDFLDGLLTRYVES